MKPEVGGCGGGPLLPNARHKAVPYGKAFLLLQLTFPVRWKNFRKMLTSYRNKSIYDFFPLRMLPTKKTRLS